MPLLGERFLKDAELDVRLSAIRTLGSLRDKAAIPTLAKALEDPDPAVQYRAVASLKQVSGRDLGDDVNAWREWALDQLPAVLHGRSLRHFERFFNVASQHDCKISDECSIISRTVPRASPQIQFFRNCRNNACSLLSPPFVVDVKYLSCVSNFEIMMFFPVFRSFVKTGKKTVLNGSRKVLFCGAAVYRAKSRTTQRPITFRYPDYGCKNLHGIPFRFSRA